MRHLVAQHRTGRFNCAAVNAKSPDGAGDNTGGGGARFYRVLAGQPAIMIAIGLPAGDFRQAHPHSHSARQAGRLYVGFAVDLMPISCPRRR
jgi:hypothetical protein